MRQDAKQTEKTLSALLETWGGALTRLQIDMPGEKALDAEQETFRQGQAPRRQRVPGAMSGRGR